ncbi:hypothetical protein A3H22_03885 [Candidatus Peribacteria bacterium RIFCSPLOWO2_12_FULL_55_15]|nr:MAG: hypothetical protein A3D12_04405 [Candidatus Peribacteria bacterium RIFCSPHIGHO2_02_FULL_55_24]OGJ68598.1 MAG: hypothetical protein A3H90_03795 [Candidatus Peribacteria bacterium RIFCSPLOWO2_02_FULL_55_36]OGJ71847.1 MAG: hypothetical protein A3H22_03885 [Candidatus Peribacteria bacterium RIFCSPLOWO2_12_FULL_55_15]
MPVGGAFGTYHPLASFAFAVAADVRVADARGAAAMPPIFDEAVSHAPVAFCRIPVIAFFDVVFDFAIAADGGKTLIELWIT